MNLHQALQKHSNIEVEILLAHILKKSGEFLYLHPEYKLTIKQLNDLIKLIKRREKGEPLAYILGYKYFCGLKFKVNKNVLIPRPETEWLVERSLILANQFVTIIDGRQLLSQRSKKFSIKILDMATGSGCIAISLFKQLTTYQLTNLQLSASDISPKALIVAKINAKTHEVNIHFIQNDLFEKIPGKFDIIIANLPYVPLTRYEKLISNLKFEPRSALTDGGDEWHLYRKFFTQLPKHLNPGGTAILEIDEESRKDLTKMIKQILPKFSSRFYKDLSGFWRYVEIQKTVKTKL